jgi:hypothetical protein
MTSLSCRFYRAAAQSSQAVCLPKLHIPDSIPSTRLRCFKSIKSTLTSHSEKTSQSENMEAAEWEISGAKRSWREVQVRSEEFESADNHSA